MKEIDRRRPVWNALSEFYLDTELSDRDLDWITKVFKASGYSLHKLKAIDKYEVFPLLQDNLLSVAGEWAGFRQEFINTECEKLYRKRHHLIFRLKTYLMDRAYSWMRKHYWEEIEKRWN